VAFNLTEKIRKDTNGKEQTGRCRYAATDSQRNDAVTPGI